MKQEFITGAELNERLSKPLPERQVILTNPRTDRDWLLDGFVAWRGKAQALTESEKRRLLDGDWVHNEPQRISGKTWVMAELIYHEVKPPYRYEFIPGKQTVIIGRDDKKYLVLSNSNQFPQHLVNILDKVVEMKNKY